MNCTSHDTNRIIGNKIYQLRRSINMTQQELADKIGISVTFLSEIENGRKSMSVDTLVKLSKGLQVSLDTIVFGNDTENDMQKDVVSMMATLPLEYNESILLIAREFTRLNRNKNLISIAEDTPSHRKCLWMGCFYKKITVHFCTVIILHHNYLPCPDFSTEYLSE